MPSQAPSRPNLKSTLFQADPPDPSKIPENDALGVTIVLLICSYLGREFVRVGYYVNNDYIDPELRETPPEIPQFDKVRCVGSSSAFAK